MINYYLNCNGCPYHFFFLFYNFLQDFLHSFPIRRQFDSYHNVKAPICYKNAVIGYHRKGFSWIELREHLTYSYGFQTCNEDRPKITILQRRTRRILNIDDILQATKDFGYNNSAVYTFEDLSLIEQYRVIYCTDVLVGMYNYFSQSTTPSGDPRKR